MFENSYIMYIYVPNGIRNSYAKRDRNWSRTYHSLPYAQTDNYDPIKTRRYETGVGKRWKNFEFRVRKEEEEEERGGINTKYFGLSFWRACNLEDVPPSDGFFALLFLFSVRGLLEGLLEFVFALARCQGN